MIWPGIQKHLKVFCQLQSPLLGHLPVAAVQPVELGVLKVPRFLVFVVLVAWVCHHLEWPRALEAGGVFVPLVCKYAAAA